VGEAFIPIKHMPREGRFKSLKSRGLKWPDPSILLQEEMTRESRLSEDEARGEVKKAREKGGQD